MSKFVIVLSIIEASSFLFLFFFFVASGSTAMTAHEALRAHGLPVGLLPKGVAGFELDEGSGRFEVVLEEPCTARFESEVRYERNVTGTISYGHIASLSGVTAHELFLWFSVKEIRVDVPSSGLIYFDVGVIYKQFSLSLFDAPPECHISTDDDIIRRVINGHNLTAA